MNALRRLFPLPLVLVLSVAAVADEDKKPDDAKTEAKKDKEEKPKEIKFSGTLEAALAEELILRPESWSSFKVKTAVGHGSAVDEGDELIAFETEDIDKKIDDSERALQSSNLSLKLAEWEFETAEKTYPLDRITAERAREIAKQDLDYFENVTLPQKKESAERSLDLSKFRLEYAQEELKQLNQMYKADELTEQTEEIILTRAKRDVESAKFSLKLAQTHHDKTLEVDLPRQIEQMKTTTEKTLLDNRKTLETMDLNLKKKELDFQQKVLDQEKNVKDLAELKKDRELMTISAPVAGVVYYGQSTRGKWNGVAAAEKQLRPGGSVPTNQVVLTVVDPDSIFLRIDVPEDKLKDVSAGTKGHVVPKAFPDMKIDAEVAEVSLVPISPGTFDGQVTLKLEKRPARLMPGMACDFVIAAATE